MASKIVVYSCIIGPYDNPGNTIFNSMHQEDTSIEFILFTDNKTIDPGNSPWQIRPPYFSYPNSNIRTARWHKVNAHTLFEKADYTIWMDGTLCFDAINIQKDLLTPFLDKHDIATFNHPKRDCVYDEVNACIKFKKDKPKIMRRQIKKYKKDGYPQNNGLVETTCVLRRQSDAVAKFNRSWWREIKENSFRDQLSFNYVSWSENVPYGHIPGSRVSSPYFKFIDHKQNTSE